MHVLRTNGNKLASDHLAAVERHNHAHAKNLHPAKGAHGDALIRLANGAWADALHGHFQVNVDSASIGPDGHVRVLAWGKNRQGMRKQGLVNVDELSLSRSTRHLINAKVKHLSTVPNVPGRTVAPVDGFDAQQIKSINFFSPSRHHHNSQLPQARALSGSNRVLAQSLPTQARGGGTRTHLSAGDSFHPTSTMARQYDTRGPGKGKDFVEWTYGWVDQGGKKVNGWLITGYKTHASNGFRSLLR